MDPAPAWVDIGYITPRGQPPAAHRGDGLRRDGGASRQRGGGLRTATLVLVGITLIAYVVAIWAMSTKPT